MLAFLGGEIGPLCLISGHLDDNTRAAVWTNVTIFFPFLFTFESAATTDIDWVELFPPVKLCNICVDLKMSAEPTFTE